MKLTVDTGIDKRTIVSGIAEYCKPEKIVGKQVSVCEYMHALGKINEWMCRKADKSYEVVVGIPLEIKK